MSIITSIGVVALASMAAILINDYTRIGGRLDDGDDNFSVFSRPVAPVSLRMDDSSSKTTVELRSSVQRGSSQAKEVARV